METLDQNSNNQISERAIRNLSMSAIWVIIASSVGLFTGLYFMYGAFQLMSSFYGSQQGGILLIMSLIFSSIHIVGLIYGVSLTKLKVFSAEDFEKASARHNAYWIFCGVVYIIWFLLLLMALSGGGNPFGRL
jgi:hypothetical protein